MNNKWILTIDNAIIKKAKEYATDRGQVYLIWLKII